MLCLGARVTPYHIVNVEEPQSIGWQEVASCLRILENTIKAPESGKHETARKCSALLPIRFPAFCRVHVLSAPERSEGQTNMTPRHLRKVDAMRLTKFNIAKVGVP